MYEADYLHIICVLLLGGTPEVRLPYEIDDGRHHVRADCLTDSHAIEIGLDARRSSQDSVHQAIFAASLSARDPMVILVDTNGVEEALEYQVETVARSLGVEYLVLDRDALIRLQMTAPFRDRAPIAMHELGRHADHRHAAGEMATR
ncbi:MAG: hypothetical protein AAF914_09320 [Pseudomonadota bacterium]